MHGEAGGGVFALGQNPPNAFVHAVFQGEMTLDCIILTRSGAVAPATPVSQVAGIAEACFLKLLMYQH